MAKNFYQRIATPHGETVVHVNRRGCKGPWTEADAKALEGLVAAVRQMEADKHSAPGTMACGHFCGWVEPYGFVPEADCPVHDAPKVKL